MKFSIVMTVFKKHELLRTAIQCVCDQTYGDWELLIYVDGDMSKFLTNVVRNAATEKHIRIIHYPQPRGTFGNQARHRGMNEATGDYIVWYGHDNIIYPEYLNAHRTNFEQDSHCLSVVPIRYWHSSYFKGTLPLEYKISKIDLLCFSMPISVAKEINAFGPEHETVYAADWRAFFDARNLGLQPIRNNSFGPVGAHF